MPDYDAIVIGAGAVGLAIARALALSGRETLILEAADAFGTETSSRNSEVIHAGIYYPKDSLKARLCVEGNQRLCRFCDARGVSYQRCGKLIVAADSAERTAIESLARRGAANGVDGLRLLEGREARALEPGLRCEAALSSPATGIVDSHGFMLALLGEAEDHGATLALRTPFLHAERRGGMFSVGAGGAEPIAVSCAELVNSAGLSASRVAEAIWVGGAWKPPATRYAKGNYFALRGRSPFTRLIYPAPQAHGLGVHLTLDLAGQARFGPDVQWIDAIDYAVDPRRCEGFVEAIRRYWPDMKDDALVPAYSGVRPKLGGPDDSAADFRIDGPETHGASGLVHLFGIESPGLTAALAIAEVVVQKLAAAKL
jgi:L-2-hydroxyglutarate oxidase LhgO